MTIKLVIFDMDGTLVDSELCAAQAICDVLPDLSLHSDEVAERYRGMKLSVILNDIAVQHNLEIPEDAISRYRVREAELAGDLIQVNPGVQDALQSLSVDFCVASNAPASKTTRTLRACKLYRYFENRIYSAYDVKAWKPDPTLFRYAAQSRGCKPEHCLVIEDSDTGLEAALAAGMKALFYNPHARSSVHEPVEQISSFCEISKFA